MSVTLGQASEQPRIPRRDRSFLNSINKSHHECLPQLEVGAILTIARTAGIALADSLEKQSICCPLHGDVHASAFIDGARNVFYCSVCTAPKAWGVYRFARALRLPSRIVALTADSPRRTALHATGAIEHQFTAKEARKTWIVARERAMAGKLLGVDAAVLEFLNSRGLRDAIDLAEIGVLGPGMRLPPGVRSWPARGYRLLLPLYGPSGEIANVHARAVNGANPKTMFPYRSAALGTWFASSAGLELLRGNRSACRVVIGEGLTDFLGLSLATPLPVLSLPGTQFAAAAFGPWAAGCDLLLVFDADRAGEVAVREATAAAHAAGARHPRVLRWPAGINDACDAVSAHGIAWLRDCLREFAHD